MKKHVLSGLLGMTLLAAPQRLPAQPACASQIDALRQDLRGFDAIGRLLPPGFPRADVLEAQLGASLQGLGGGIHPRLVAWNDRIQGWADVVAGYRQCLRDSGCKIDEFLDRQQAGNREAADWLRTIGDDGFDKATQTADRASDALRDYESGSGGRISGSIAKALSCTAADPPPSQAPPRAPEPRATPPPLPPNTVNQGGLNWDLEIGACAVKGPFRFSLCEGRYLRADEVSRPCTPSLISGVMGGHNASYVFSPGHGQFLPKGLGVDGFGILSGDSCKLLRSGTRLPLCVRQLDVESCGSYEVGTKTAKAEPKAKKGPNAALAVAGIAALAGAVAVGATALEEAAALSEASGGSGGNSSSIRMSFVGSSGISCTFNAGGIISSCTAQVTVNITGSIPAGSNLRLTGSFWGGNRITSASPPGSTTFTLSGGTGGSSCPGPLTSLNLLNLSQSTSVVIASTGGFSIPVTCR